MARLDNLSKARLVNAAKALAEIRSGIMSARSSLTVLTPGLAADSLAFFATELSAATARGADVLVVTRPLHEDGACKLSERGAVEEILASLRASGVILVLKTGMREKLMLADGKVVWTASFPPLARPDESGFIEVRGAIDASRPLRFSEEVTDCLGLGACTQCCARASACLPCLRFRYVDGGYRSKVRPTVLLAMFEEGLLHSQLTRAMHREWAPCFRLRWAPRARLSGQRSDLDMRLRAPPSDQGKESPPSSSEDVGDRSKATPKSAAERARDQC